MPQVELGDRAAATERDARLRVLVATLAVFVICAASGWARTLPVIAPDEPGFISQAQLLAGVPAINMGSEPYYHFGYSLLLVPVWWITQDPLAAYKGMMVINAALAALLVPLLVGISSALGFRRSPALVLAATLLALWPSSFLVSHFAWSDALFRVVFAANAWAALRLVQRPSLGWAVVLAVTAAALFAVHPKALLILVLAPLLLVALRGLRVIDSRAAVAALAVFAILVAVQMLAMGALHAALWHADAYSVQETLLGRLLRPEALLIGLIVALGQLWYQMAASLGLAALGIWFAVRYLLASHNVAMRLVVSYLLIATLAVALASVIQMLQPLRVDHVAYGRYIDGASVLLLWLGLCWLLFGAAGEGQRIAGAVALGIILLGGTVLATQEMMAGLKQVDPHNVAGLGWLFPAGSTPWQFFGLTSALLAVVAALLLLLNRTGRLIVLAGYVTVSAVFIHFVTAQHAKAQLGYLSADVATILGSGLQPIYWTDEVRTGLLWAYHLQYALGASFRDLDGPLPPKAGLLSLQATGEGMVCTASLPGSLYLLANPADAEPGC